VENSKRKKATPKEVKLKQVIQKEIVKEVAVKVDAIRQEKKEKKLKTVVPEKPKPVLKVGDRVRMYDGKAIGTIDKIEKTKAIVNYGVFTSTVNLSQLEYVQP
jgi:DNA mismatch repair protein MutS2